MDNAAVHILEVFRRDWPSPADEWDYIIKFQELHPAEREAILEAVFLHSRAYNATRVLAGYTWLRDDLPRLRSYIAALVVSQNPDDRDTALTLLQDYAELAAPKLALPLLADPSPYSRLEAAEFLHQHYPERVEQTLQELMREAPPRIREAAQQLLKPEQTTSAKSIGPEWKVVLRGLWRKIFG